MPTRRLPTNWKNRGSARKAEHRGNSTPSCAGSSTAGDRCSGTAGFSLIDTAVSSHSSQTAASRIRQGTIMSNPKILIFAPREEPPETINALESLGCEVVFGDRDWQLPRMDHESAVVEAARDAVALMGTSMRHTPISRRIMQASQRLRIVAKYTVGVDDVDVDAATDLGVMVCHAPTESNC